MTSREWDRAYAEASGDWSEYVKKWRGDMTERMAIVRRSELEELERAARLAAPYVDNHMVEEDSEEADDAIEAMGAVHGAIAASPNAGKLSQAQITAAIDAMKDCGLPYMPWQRREIIVQIVAKSFGLEIE